MAARGTARTNNASGASFDRDSLDRPFASGTFRWVAKGKYTEGKRKGEPCVTKWFKSGITFEEEFFEQDLKAVDKALEILKKWNKGGYNDKHVQLNKPEVWTFTKDSSKKRAGSKTLVEPFIKNYQKFNSNTGWNNDRSSCRSWSHVMQAISHFSYHISSGQFVLCDLQGGIDRDGIVLTDPVILSKNKSYGPTDLGPMGISTFFSRHQCNKFCEYSWMKPRDATPYFEENVGSSMISAMDHLSLAHGRRLKTNRNTNIVPIYEDEEEEEEYYRRR